MHQIAVIKEERKSNVARLLLRKLVADLIEENNIRNLRFAIRKDNKASYGFASTAFTNPEIMAMYSIKSLGVDALLSKDFEMEIFELTIK